MQLFVCHTGIVADAGPGPLLLPLGGSALVAGIFLSLAVVAGGWWFARWMQDRPAPKSRRLFWHFSGCAALFAALPVAVFGLFMPLLFLVAIILLVLGVTCIVVGVKSGRLHEVPVKQPLLE